MPPVTRSSAAKDDIRDQPAYTVAEAARYLRVSSATLRTWVAGRDYPTAAGAQRWKRLIEPAASSPPLLSFWNVIEAHVLWGLRTNHSVAVKAVRDALDVSQRELGVERLLLSKDLCTSAGKLFLETYGELIELSASRQIVMQQLFQAHLHRVVWDKWKFPVRLFPFVAPEAGIAERSISIDPGIAFGRPITRRGVTTEVIADRIDAGESLADVAADYGLELEEVKEALMYEHAA